MYNDGFVIMSGADYFVDGRVAFPREDDEEIAPELAAEPMDGTYRSAFGPCFSHNGTIYCNCNSCVSLAMSRLTAIREPDRPGYDRLLTVNQHHFHNQHSDFITLLRDTYAEGFDEYENMELEALKHHDDPHPKRELRKQAWLDLQEGDVIKRKWLRVVLYKMKKDEWAKLLKVPRMIGDLGVAASLQGFIITAILKDMQAKEPIRVHGGVLVFVKKPKPGLLHELFHELMDPTDRFHFAYFSDDSCLAIRVRGKVHTFNLDIKKCDASHQQAIFDSFVLLFPEAVQDDARILVEQCTLPIEVRDRASNKKVRMRPKHATLYSGSTVTTAINNLANQTIGFAIGMVDFEAVDDENIVEAIQAAALTAGYLISCETCNQPEDIQFLKHSPVLADDGEWRPMLNLGVLLRASGVCKGDLPGKKTIPLKTRAENFQRSLLHGAYPRISTPFIDTMKAQCGPGAISWLEDLQYKVVDDSTYPFFSVSTENAFRRYRLTNVESLELMEAAGFGYEYHHCLPGADAIFQADYGLSAKEA